MKKIAICLGLMLSLTAFSQGTLQRSIITSSQLFRNLATNETTVSFLTMLQAQLGITNINVTVTVYGITNAFPTNTQTIALLNNILFVGTNWEAQSANLDLWSALSTNALTGKVDNSTYNAAWGAVGTNAFVRTNETRGVVVTNANNLLGGTFTGLLSGTTNAGGDFAVFNNDTRAISLPNAAVSNATTSVTSGTATNVVGLLQTNSVTTNGPINGSFVIWKAGSQFYMASSNITFDGSVLILTNIGSLAGASLTTNGNFSASGWVAETGPLTNKSTAYLPTNTAPVAPTLNPLTSGSVYTTPLQRGWVSATCLATNNANGWLTNMTSHEVRTLGSVTGVGTNYANASLRTSPGDQVVLTNQSGVLNLISSSFDGD